MLRFIFVPFILISIYLDLYKCLDQSSSSFQNYTILKINKKIIQLQKQIAKTYKLNLYYQQTHEQKYLVIDISVYFLELKSRIQICLNFDKDILKDEIFLNSGMMNCTYTDKFPRIQQKQQQYLLVIDTKDKNIAQKKDAYLTLIYKNNESGNLNLNQQFTQQLNFIVLMQYLNSRPCHGNCNQDGGVCDQNTGQCNCNQNYFNLDCNVEVKKIEFDHNFEFNIAIQKQKTLYYRANLTQIIQYRNDNNLSLTFKRMLGDSQIDIQILFNIEELPSNQNQHKSLQVISNEIVLMNINDQCLKYKNNKSQTSERTVEMTKRPSIFDNSCFAIISISQDYLNETSILVVSYDQNKIENKLTNNYNHTYNNPYSYDLQKKNQTYATIQQIKKPTNKNVYEKVVLIIVIISFIFLAIISILIKKLKINKIQQNTIFPKVSTQYSDDMIQVLNQINHLRKIEQLKKCAISKKRFLQENFMPILVYQYFQPYCNSNENKFEQQIHQSTQNSINPKIFLNFQKEQQKLVINQQKMKFTNQISQEHNNSYSNKQNCSICLRDFIPEDIVRKTICSHIFHVDCFKNWLDEVDNCPLCRQSFEIIDMIDYLTNQIQKKQIHQNKVVLVNKEKNKINSILKEKNNQIIQMTNEEFVSTFSYFLPNKQREQDVENIIQNYNNIQNSDNSYIISQYNNVTI